MSQHHAPAKPWMQETLRQGFDLLNAGRLQEASNCCQKLISAQPDLVEAHFLVGLIALELDQAKIALSAFGSVTKLAREHGAAWAHLAKLFISAGQPLRADAALKNAESFHDNKPVVMNLIGTICGQLGDQQQASRWISKAVRKEPHNVGFLINQANNQLFHGAFDNADATLDKVLSLQSGNPNAHWIKSNVRKATSDSHIREMRKLLPKHQASARARAFLHYAIGKELEDLQEWEEAFKAFDAGARARRSTINYDENAETEMYEAFSNLFTREWLDQQTSGHADPAPIFIVGQPRTGTTLVERVITSHSQVHSAGELQQFGTCVRRLTDYREPKINSAKLAELALVIDAAQLGKAYMTTTSGQRGTLPHFVDKLPPNYLYIPLILAALPRAKIIHLQRDPMDACFASYKQLFAEAYPHSYAQDEIARHHARYFQLMAVWRQRFSDRFLDISYEETARNLEPHARAIIDYLELPWEDNCLQFHQQTTAVTTASAVQVREPAHTRSIGRWRRYENQLGEMRNTLEACSVPLTTAPETGEYHQ